MDLIDDEGNLFGIVNIIDVLVVLFVVAIVVAGVALVLGADEAPGTDDDAGTDRTELATVYATIDIGTVPDSLAGEISVGDSYSPGGPDNLTITDVHRTPTNGGTQVLVRVAIQGEPLDNGIVEYDGAPPRLERSVEIVTDYYRIEGTIQDVGGVASFTRDDVRVDVLLEGVHEAVASGIEVGMTKRVEDEIIAEIIAVESQPTTIVRTTDSGEVRFVDHPTDRDVTVTLAVQTVETPNGTRFGGQRLRQGVTVVIDLDQTRIEGQLVSLE